MSLLTAAIVTASQVENKAARTHAIKEAKEFITRWADAAGMGHKQAKAYADSLFDLGEKARDLPKEAKTDVKVTGLDTVLGRMRDLNAYADALNGRTIHMDTRLDRGTPARKDGGAVWQMQDFRVGEVGPEMFVGASGNVGIIGEHGPTTMRFAEPGVVIPNDALPNWVTDRLERPAYATATAPSAAAGGDTVPDVHLHFHGDQGQPTPAELEAMIIAAWRRYERERKERS
jgi:hypothetical protein